MAASDVDLRAAPSDGGPETDDAGAARAGDRRVLMLCYLFPPIRSAGTHRSVAFATGLPAFGWLPTVLTVSRHRDPAQTVGEPEPRDVPTVRAYEFNLHGMTEWLQGATNRVMGWLGGELRAHFFRDHLAVPDPQIAWVSWLRGRRLARAADCIYASCSPFSSALSAVRLGRASGKPVVLDFRDAWLLNPHNLLTGRRRRIVARLERRVIEGASRLILNTPGAARLYREQYPEHAPKFVVIPNGYDTLAPASGEGVRSGEFRIVHIGSFYGRRTPDALLEALVRIGRDDVVFEHAGPSFAGCERYRDRVNIRLLGTLSRQQAQAALQRASLLYLKQGHEAGIEHYIAVASKTYEYLATGLPILADCPNGDNADIVREFCLSPFVVTSGSAEELEATIRLALASRAHLPVGVSPAFTARFDRRRLTHALSQVLDAAVDGVQT